MPSKNTKKIVVTQETYELIVENAKKENVDQTSLINACLEFGTNHHEKIMSWYRKKLKRELNELCR